MKSGLNNSPRLRARGARGFVLLVLLAHAFVVSATHFHNFKGLDTSRANNSAVSQRDESRKAPLANGEEQCLVCRLQRNFGAGLMRHATPEVVALDAKFVAFAALEQTYTPTVRILSAKGRAPPLS